MSHAAKMSAAASLLIVLAGCATPPAGKPGALVEIPAIIAAQQAAWNRGDLDAFMQPYWKSDQLTFSSGGQTRRGWDETYARYQAAYPTRERMGKLTFDQLELRPLCESAVLVLGRWTLDRESDSLGGNFSLVFQRISGAWRIIHDHTSLAPAENRPPPTSRPAP